MFQIDNSTAVAAIPAPTPAGSAGYFTDGNPATGVSATILPAEFMNMLMMENMNVLSAAGITPAKGQYNQLALAIAKIVQSGAAGPASEATAGILELATSPQALAGTNDSTAITPLKLAQKLANFLGQATEAAFGWLKIATQALVNAGADDATAVTPKKLAAAIQNQTLTAFTTGGSAGALTLTPVPAIQAYASPLRFRVKFSQNSTGADTINVSGQGAKSLKQYDSTGAKVAAVFAANQLSDIEYDGTDFVLLDQLPTTIAQRKQSFRGLSKNLKVSASGTSANILLTADSVIVANSSGDALALGAISATLNTAVTGSATVDGMAAGVALAANTWYAVYAWYNSTTGVTRIFGDTSFTTPTAPSAGFDMWALISVFRTDSSGSKFPLGFTQTGVKWRYTVKAGTNVATSIVLASGTTSGATTSLLLTAVAPPGITVISVGLTVQNASSGGVSPNNQYGSWASLTNPQPLSSGANATQFATTTMGDIILETPNTIWWGANSTAVTVTVNGFEVPQ